MWMFIVLVVRAVASVAAWQGSMVGMIAEHHVLVTRQCRADAAM